MWSSVRRQAQRFAHDFHTSEPALLRLKVTCRQPKHVRSDDQGWQGEGYDGCRADRGPI